MVKNFEDSYRAFSKFYADFEAGSSRNEATTRLQLIDTIFFDCLGWGKEDCLAEEHHEGTYSDYSFGKYGKRLIVEAKKEGDYFDLPAGFDDRVCSLKTLFKGNENIENAVRQALGYCLDRGVPIGAITNGTQIIGFLGSRQDGVPPIEGKAVVFKSIEDMDKNFKDLWNNFSKAGVENYYIFSTLKSLVSVPPEKLSNHLINYPGFKNRNEIQTELQLLGGLFLEDITKEPSLEQEFLKECYCPSGALSQYALVSRQILEARYSSLFKTEIETDLTDVGTKKGLTPQMSEDIVAAGLSRRPIILLGEVGSGKSMFIRHFIKVEAEDVLKRALVIYIDFGKEPALPEKLTDFVLQSCKQQLRDNYNIHTEDLSFVSGVYGLELEHFRHKGLYSQLRETNKEVFQQKEIEFLEDKIKNGPEHLKSCLEHISKAQERQIVVFLDNIDQRPLAFQDEVFLIGHGLAEAWPGTIFISLRPDTFFHSKKKGSITGYQPRVFTISPPRVDRVILKRLEFAMRTLSSTGTLESLPQGTALKSTRLLDYIQIIHKSFTENRDLIEFVDNVSGGNIRQAIGFFTAFIGSGHVDTAKILTIFEEEQRYIIPLHEFFRGVIYGDTEHYDPSSAPVPNLLDISSPDGREHFLLSIILMQVERLGGMNREQGYVLAKTIYDFCQEFGYQPLQIKSALGRAVATKLLESNPKYISSEEEILHYRITTVGAYSVKKMLGFFNYLDAIIVDTPIVEEDARAKIVDIKTLHERLTRIEVFCKYLDEQWLKISNERIPFNWTHLSTQVKEEIRKIRAKST